MSMEIYYFTGSGNSLFVIKELQKLVPGARCIPIVSLLDEDIIATRAGTVGLVFPIHGMTVPIPVRKFIKKLRMNSTEYLFAIATRGGTWHNAFAEIDKTLLKSGRKLDACFTINMPSNDPKFKDWQPPTEGELAKVESVVRARLDTIRRALVAKEKRLENANDGVLFPAGILIKNFALFGMFFMERTGANHYFFSDAKCAGCGTCAKVCPSRKVTIVDEKPVWQNNVQCYFCYACVNYCPKKAVQIRSKVYMRSYTEDNDRYSHPYATISEMAGQKYH